MKWTVVVVAAVAAVVLVLAARRGGDGIEGLAAERPVESGAGTEGAVRPPASPANAAQREVPPQEATPVERGEPSPRPASEKGAAAARFRDLRATFLTPTPDVAGLNGFLGELVEHADVAEMDTDDPDSVTGTLTFEGTDLRAEFTLDAHGDCEVVFRETYPDGSDPESEHYPWRFSVVRVMFRSEPDGDDGAYVCSSPRLLVHYQGLDSDVLHATAPWQYDPQGRALHGWFAELDEHGRAHLVPRKLRTRGDVRDPGNDDAGSPIQPFDTFAGPAEAHRKLFALIGDWVPPGSE